MTHLIVGRTRNTIIRADRAPEGVGKAIDKALDFAAEKLNITKPRVLFTNEPDGTYGRYAWTAELITISASLDTNCAVHTLFHEMVHHQQHEHKRLHVIESTYLWKIDGEEQKAYKIDSYRDYWDAPHEVEARKVADELYEEYGLSPYSYGIDHEINALLMKYGM